MRALFTLLIFSLLASAAPVAVVRAQREEPSVTLQPEQRFYYEGDAVAVRLAVRNGGDAKVRNPVRKGAASGIEIRNAAGEVVDSGAATGGGRTDAPRELDPGASYVVSIDLSAVEGLSRSGTYELLWAASGKASDPVEVTVLPRFDRAEQYTARLETDLGRIDIQLFGEVSPLAVKAFVDLARAGYYDGSSFTETLADSHIVGGPRSDRPGQPLQRFPAEHSDVVVLPGTVVMKPLGPAPPTNGPEFIIALSPQPAWTGQVTALGQVSRGLEIVQRISRLPKTGADGRRPAQRVRIVHLTITSEGG
jgi:cyclophilin family peptidyl-prolyl cis-trans isomerase